MMMWSPIALPPCNFLGDFVRTGSAFGRASCRRYSEVVQRALSRDRGLPLYQETGKGDRLVSPR